MSEQNGDVKMKYTHRIELCLSGNGMISQVTQQTLVFETGEAAEVAYGALSKAMADEKKRTNDRELTVEVFDGVGKLSVPASEIASVRLCVQEDWLAHVLEVESRKKRLEDVITSDA